MEWLRVLLNLDLECTGYSGVTSFDREGRKEGQ